MVGTTAPAFSLVTAVGLLFGMATVGGSAAQSQQHKDWCAGQNHPTDEQIIIGCDGMINSPMSVLNNRLGDAYYNRGLAHRRLGNLGKAWSDFLSAIGQNRNDADAYVARGNVEFAWGRFERAVADFSQAISINPNHGLAYKNRSAAYASLGDRQRAISDYERAAALGVRD